MKTRTVSLLCCMVTFIVLTAFAGKLITKHVLVDPNGINGKIAFDENGNAIQVFPTYTNIPGNALYQLDYKAYNKKGEVYSQGTLPGIAGVNNFTMPLFLSQGAGGFDGKMLLLRFGGAYTTEAKASSSFSRYAMYKLGKRGAAKINEIEFAISNGFSVVYMYKGKVVTEFGEYSSNGLIRFTIAIYNKKLLRTKRGGTIMAQNGAWEGKAAAFLTYSGNTNCAVSIAKP